MSVFTYSAHSLLQFIKTIFYIHLSHHLDIFLFHFIDFNASKCGRIKFPFENWPKLFIYYFFFLLLNKLERFISINIKDSKLNSLSELFQFYIFSNWESNDICGIDFLKVCIIFIKANMNLGKFITSFLIFYALEIMVLKIHGESIFQFVLF